MITSVPLVGGFFDKQRFKTFLVFVASKPEGQPHFLGCIWKSTLALFVIVCSVCGGLPPSDSGGAHFILILSSRSVIIRSPHFHSTGGKYNPSS